MTAELTEAEIVAILREKARASAHNRYLLNREVYKRRAAVRYALNRDEVCRKWRERYASDPQFRADMRARQKRS